MMLSSVDGNGSAYPGADLHSWESQWASIDEDAADDPDAALGQYLGVVERILVTGGFAIDDPVARQGEAPELIATFLTAREVAERAEVGRASRTEVEQAIEDLRSIFGSLMQEVGLE